MPPLPAAVCSGRWKAPSASARFTASSETLAVDKPSSLIRQRSSDACRHGPGFASTLSDQPSEAGKSEAGISGSKGNGRCETRRDGFLMSPLKESMMQRQRNALWAGIVLSLAMSAAQADIVFTFTEAGGTVTMTSSGTLDTTQLVSVVQSDGWGGTGTENNSSFGDIDIMGGTSFGEIDTQFGFSAGTDASAITSPGGPFAFSSFPSIAVTGSKSFTTYSGYIGALRQPGIGIVGADVVGGLWTPDQNWTYDPGVTFAGLGLVAGTYAVSDALTGETITIQIGAVPEPASLVLFGLGLAGLVASRRIKGSLQLG